MFDICDGCGCFIDPDFCHCGETERAHSVLGDHQFVPSGCDCSIVFPVIDGSHTAEVEKKIADRRTL